VSAVPSAGSARLDALRLEPADPRWLAFVASHDDALPFHRPGWLEAVSRTYGFRSFIVALARPDGNLAAGLPLMEIHPPLRAKRWVSVPFADYSPPLVTGGNAEELVAAANRAREAAGAARLDVHAFVPGGVEQASAVRHILPLGPDLDAIFSTFSRSQVQRNIRKGETSGLTLRRGDSRSDLVERYFHLHLRTRRRLGVPSQPRGFFERLWTHVLEPGGGFVLLVESDGTPVAGAVFLLGKQTVVYKYGASEQSWWRLRPNHLIFAEAIRWSASHGFATFDFGRTDLQDAGLHAFKAGWGTREEPLVYTSYGARAGAPSGAGGLMHVARAVIRRCPPAVSRLTGALFYRYAA
jgi:CelD/BcsL family acetyltransferase involved in cellulose biosynthesis